MTPRKREILAAMQPVVDMALKRPAVRTAVRANVVNDTTTEVMIYGAIGGDGWDSDSVNAAGFAEVLDGITTPVIELRMNSGGGDVFQGTAIHTLIARHPATVVGTVDGLAASAASFIMMACDKIRVARNGMFMIHDGMTLAYGGPATMKRTMDLLDKVSDNIADMYAVRAGGDAEEWREVMSKNGEDGTWYTGREAVDAGLADEIVEPRDDEEVTARVRAVLMNYTGAPVYEASVPAPEDEDVPEVETDPRDDVAETMLAFLAARMKGNS